jgi:hypothetical protein
MAEDKEASLLQALSAQNTTSSRLNETSMATISEGSSLLSSVFDYSIIKFSTVNVPPVIVRLPLRVVMLKSSRKSES